MKFFSLIAREDVHPAPDKKVIPAQEYTTLVEAAEVLKRAKEEEIAYRQKVAEECEDLKRQARKDGFEEGLKKFNAQIEYLEHELDRAHREMEKAMTPLALTAVKKIIGGELATRPEAIVDIVSTALRTVTQHRRVAIYVNKSDLDTVEEHRPQIKQLFEHLESLSIAAREDVDEGGCIIETEAGIINAQLENQLKALETAFSAFFKNNNLNLSKGEESD